jgi:hypothetical protein
MLHIAFAELMRGGAEQMLAGEGRFGMHQRHHVLQLVAESIGAAGLIKPGPAPEPAAQGLIQQPAVRHHIHGGIGRIHVHRAEGSIPIGPDAFERNAAGVRPAKTLDQVLHLRRVAADPEAETRFPFLPIRQIEGDLHRAARIQPAPTLPERRARFSAAGCDRLPFLPMNSFRSPVSVRVASLTSMKTMRRGTRCCSNCAPATRRS